MNSLMRNTRKEINSLLSTANVSDTSLMLVPFVECIYYHCLVIFCILPFDYHRYQSKEEYFLHLDKHAATNTGTIIHLHIYFIYCFVCLTK